MPKKIPKPAHRKHKRPYGWTVAPLGGPHYPIEGPVHVWAKLAGGELLVMRIVDEGRAVAISLSEQGCLKVVSSSGGHLEVSKLWRGD